MKPFNDHNLTFYLWDSGYTVGKNEYLDANINVPLGMIIKKVSW